MMSKIVCFFVLIFLLLNVVVAIPGIPHQFYGDVKVNGKVVRDNNIIVAKVGADEYKTVTKDGRYGFSPNSFFVEDPDGDRKGDKIEFFIGEKKAGESVFENNGYEKIDFSLTTTCNDGYCLGDETCTSCANDCGVCSELPLITIHSPLNQTYNTTKISLETSSDQDIEIWMYSLNSGSYVIFAPNITIEVKEGSNNITVKALTNSLVTSETVYFSVELPVEETPQPSGNSGGVGGSSGGGGGGGSTSVCKIDENDVKSGTDRFFSAGQECLFVLETKENKVKLISIDSEKKEVKISVNSAEKTLGEGKSVKLNLDSDNDYDLTIKLNRIVGTSAELNLKTISETVELKLAEKSEEKKEESGKENIDESNVEGKQLIEGDEAETQNVGMIGAVIGTVGVSGAVGIIVFFVVILALLVFVFVRRERFRGKRGKAEGSVKEK